MDWQTVPTPPPSSAAAPLALKPLVDESIDDVGKSAHDYITRHYSKQLKIGIAASVVFELLLVFGLYQAYKAGIQINLEVIFIFLVPGFVYVYVLNSVTAKIRHEFYQQFAQANSYSYQLTGWLDGMVGGMFTIGHDKSQQDIVTGNFLNDQLVLLNYTYVTGSGKSRVAHERTIFKIGFKNDLPPLILISNSMEIGAENWFPNATKIQLEGDFGKFFSLYAEDKFQVEALQVFDPAFMQQMLTQWPKFSLDFVGKQLYVYAPGIITDKQGLTSMFDLVESLIKKLNPELVGMQTTITELEGQTKTIAPTEVSSGFSFRKFFTNSSVIIFGITTIVLLFFLFLALTASK